MKTNKFLIPSDYDLNLNKDDHPTNGQIEIIFERTDVDHMNC